MTGIEYGATVPGVPSTINYAKATRLLSQGASVRQVALQLGCTTQAIYYAIGMGYIQRPSAA